MCSNAYKLFLNFKILKWLYTYSSALVMKPFNNSRKLFKAEIIKIITAKPKTSLLLNALLCIHPLTFLTEALSLLVSPSVASTMSP